MSLRWRKAVEQWQDEIDTEAIRLLERGYTPSQAERMALECVCNRRRREYDASIADQERER